jgi:DNA invertase Pin-like site-specific DNA recombinase
MAAYQFALDHCEAWPVKLKADERRRALSEAAGRSAAAKRKSSQAARDRAEKLKDEGWTVQAIADEIGVSKSTVKRWQRVH